MRKKILLVYAPTQNAKDNCLETDNINPDKVDLRICTIGYSKKSVHYNLKIEENQYSNAGWIAAVNSYIVSIFDDFIPDIILLTGYNLTSVGAAIAAYFMGIQICLYEGGNIENRGIDHFPMEMGFEILNSLVDFHFCTNNETYKVLENSKISNLKFQKNKDLEKIICA